jgi:hypothetical protein
MWNFGLPGASRCGFEFLDETGNSGEGQIQRKVIWLCDARPGRLAVETGRPHSVRVRPPRSFGSDYCLRDPLSPAAKARK